MKKTMFRILTAALLISGLVSCQENPLDQTPAGPSLADNLIDIPSSLSGSADYRTVTSDAQVADSVEAYYTLAKGQVVITARAGQLVKSMIRAIERYKLIGADVDFTKEEVGATHRWDSMASDTYRLEKWNSDTLALATGGNKVFELNLVYRESKTQVSGSLIVQVANTDWGTVAPGEKAPDWIKVEFDSDKGGVVWMKASVLGYRCFADIGSSLMNTIVELTRDSSGNVTAVGNTSVPGSRHFVWDGYLKNATNQDVVNTSASSENRYYIFKGKASALNKATVSLAMAKAGYTEGSVYADYSIGTVLSQLFRDRLVNNYDFDGASSSVNDLGHQVILNLNTINASGPTLDTSVWTNNTPAATLGALSAAQSVIAATPNDVIDFLVSVMNVQNPAYFNSLNYITNGTTPASDYFPSSDLNTLTPPTQGEVDGLVITFTI